MKIVAIKLEAETKTIGAMIDLLDAQISRTVALQDELLAGGAKPDDVAKGLEALEMLAKEARQAKQVYRVFHGIVKKAQESDPNVPQPRTGT